MFREGLVNEDGLFTGAGVDTDDGVDGFDWFPAENAVAILDAVFTLLDARVERGKGLQVGAERRRQAVIRSNHADVLGISSAPCGDRETRQECCGWGLTLKRLVVMPQGSRDTVGGSAGTENITGRKLINNNVPAINKHGRDLTCPSCGKTQDAREILEHGPTLDGHADGQNDCEFHWSALVLI